MNPSRQFAMFILLILMIGAGVAASLALTGRSSTSLFICGGTLLICLVVLVVGGLLVGSSRET